MKHILARPAKWPALIKKHLIYAYEYALNRSAHVSARTGRSHYLHLHSDLHFVDGFLTCTEWICDWQFGIEIEVIFWMAYRITFGLNELWLQH